MQSTQRYQTKGKFSFRSVRLEVTVGNFLKNCSYPFPKVDFQAERFKLLATGSVPLQKATGDRLFRLADCSGWSTVAAGRL
uniref:Uncharacterized protein n=1 Tax=Romanomermis culicivorax TaxID=13658 RepID=A0A915IM61_ROMCU